jgi:hypothetical protein
MTGSIYGYTTAYRFTLPDYNVVGWHTYEYRNWQALDALLNSFVQLLNFKGVWANSTAYAINDIAADSSDGLLYKSTANHTSPATGSFSAARTATPGQWVAVDQSAFDATSNRLMKRLEKMFREAQAINANANRAYSLAVASITQAAASATLAARSANDARTAATSATQMLNSEKRVRRLVRTFNPANIAFYSQVFS